MSTVYLHIGQPKTGTTSLQRFLVVNRKNLEKNGVAYPDMPQKYLPYQGFSSDRNGAWVSLVYGMKEAYQFYLKRTLEYCKRYDKVLLSDEEIYREYLWKRGLMPEFRSQLEASGVKLKVIIYLRRQDEYVYSLWGQKIKRGRPETVQEWISQHLKEGECDYLRYINNLTEDIGEGNIIVRVYDRKGFVAGFKYAFRLMAETGLR